MQSLNHLINILLSTRLHWLIRETAICTLILASFRRLLRQGELFSTRIKLMPKIVIGGYNSYTSKLLKTPILNWMYLSQFNNPACTVDTSKLDLQRVLPLTYNTLHTPPLVTVVTTNIQAGEQVAILPLDSLFTASLIDKATSSRFCSILTFLRNRWFFSYETEQTCTPFCYRISTSGSQHYCWSSRWKQVLTFWLS